MGTRSRRLGLALALAGTFAASGAAVARAEDALGASYLGLHTKSNANVLEPENAYAGITVARVVENSPAAAAGVAVGDVLLTANGVTLGHPAALDALVAALPVGSEVVLHAERDREGVELVARTVARVAAAKAAGEEERTRTWIERRRVGFEIRRPDAARLQALGLGASEGVEVIRLAPRSPFSGAGIQVGDVLSRVEGEVIRDPADLIDFLDGLDYERSLRWRVHRVGADAREVDAPVYKPAWSVQALRVPLLFSMERSRTKSEYVALLGALRIERLEAGSRIRLLWLFEIRTGRWDELLQVEGS